MSKEREEYDRFAQWILDGAQQHLKGVDPYVLFEAWKAGAADARKRLQLSENAEHG